MISDSVEHCPRYFMMIRRISLLHVFAYVPAFNVTLILPIFAVDN